MDGHTVVCAGGMQRPAGQPCCDVHAGQPLLPPQTLRSYDRRVGPCQLRLWISGALVHGIAEKRTMHHSPYNNGVFSCGHAVSRHSGLGPSRCGVGLVGSCAPSRAQSYENSSAQSHATRRCSKRCRERREGQLSSGSAATAPAAAATSRMCGTACKRSGVYKHHLQQKRQPEQPDARCSHQQQWQHCDTPASACRRARSAAGSVASGIRDTACQGAAAAQPRGLGFSAGHAIW